MSANSNGKPNAAHVTPQLLTREGPTRMTAQTIYDEKQGIWKSLGYKHYDYVRQSLGEAFLKQVACLPAEHVLEQHYDVAVERTIGAVHRDALTVAINLKRLGVRKGDVMVLYSNVNPKLSALSMGAFMMGVAVNFFETKFSEEHAEYMMKLLAPTVLLYEEQFRARIDMMSKKLHLPQLKHSVCIDGVIGNTLAQSLLHPVPEAELTAFKLPHLGDSQRVVATLMLTSGSTGLPKAVALSHAAMLHGAITFWHTREHGSLLSAAKDTVIFSISPQRWISQVDLMLQALLLGVRRICAARAPTGTYGRDIIRKMRLTHFFSPPAVFKDILLAIDADDLDALSSLRWVWLGGEAPTEIVMQLTAKLAPQATTYRAYGMTELAGLIANDLRVNGGNVVPGHELQILNDDLQPLGPNANGQLCVRAPQSYLGYHKIDNSKSYYTNGFFNTGDYAFVDEHQLLHIVGRYKDLVRASGVILIPSHIEQLVCTIPEIFAAVLIGYRADGEHTDKDIGALFVVLKQTATSALQDSQIKQHIRKVLEQQLKQEEHEIIKGVHIIDRHPLTNCGKIDKPALIARAKAAES